MSSNKLVIKTNKNIRKLKISDLLFISTNPKSDHSLILETKNESIIISGNIYHYEQYHNLIKCHKSYIVNLSNIKNIDKSSRTISFVNSNKKCPLSRRLLSNIINKWVTI